MLSRDGYNFYFGYVGCTYALQKSDYYVWNAIFAIILICIMGTINHPNMDMSKSELQESKKSARLVVIIEAMLIAVLAYLKTDILYIGYMSVAVILCAFLMCLAKIIKQEVCVK